MVVAIIAILASILMPSLSRAKESGRDAQCRSNLRQAQIAFLGWIGEHGDVMPNPVGHTVPGRPNPTIHDVMLDEFPDYPHVTYVTDPDFRVCPSMWTQGVWRQAPPLARGWFLSYAANQAWTPLGTGWIWPSAIMKFASVPNPASFPGFMDSEYRQVSPWYANTEKVPYYFTFPFGVGFYHRQNTAFNCSFADGHVECVPGTALLAGGFTWFCIR